MAVVSPDSIVASTLGLPDTTPPVVAVVLGYSHREDADALEHETRQRLYEAITNSPGTYIAEVAETTETAVSTVRYHLRILEREDVIRSETVHGKRRLYTAASGHDEISAALNDRATTDVVEAVLRHEPASVSQLADELDRAVSTVSYHVQRLETAGVLTRERDGGSVRVEVSSSARTVVGPPVSADD
jgi:predicted transcriptional regulator